MNQYQINYYEKYHSGRTRRDYVTAATPVAAALQFAAKYPNRVMRDMWQLVLPVYYTEPATPDNTEETIP